MLNLNNGVYPYITDPNFYKKIINKKEFKDASKSEHLTPYQAFIKNFIGINTYYNSILIYASLGAGKTMASISIAENFKGSNIRIIVCVRNETLIRNYKNEMKSFNIDTKGYSFVTYNELTSFIIGNRSYSVGLNDTKVRYKKNVKNFTLNNSLLIIDEAHNITDIKLYPLLLDVLSKSINAKLVLLTGTPIYDNITEIFQINNLLNFGNPDNHLPVNEKELSIKGLISINKNDKDGSLLNDTSSVLTPLGKDMLRRCLKGKVSYYKVNNNNKNFADVSYKGVSICNKSDINICMSKMSLFQEEIYNKTLKDPNNNLFKNSIDASCIVYPNGEIGSKGFLNNKSNSSLFLQEKNIGKYSCKLFSLITVLNKCKGSAFIYSNFVNNRGTDLIRLVLLRNGFSEFKGTRNVKSFAILKGSLNPETINKYINIFNSPDNRYGDIIKVIIGSPVINEGITLKNIRQIHVLEPTWNLSKIDQIVGRGIRYLSHNALPPNERKVDIYLHCSVTSDKKQSIDYLKYLLCYKKDLAIKDAEYLLRSISIDCNFNKNINGKDFSRECLYQECEYSCPAKVMSKTDNSTYSLKIHNKNEYNFIKDRIIYLFSVVGGNIYDFKHIHMFVGKNIEPDNVKLVLYELVKNKVEFQYKILTVQGNYFTTKEIPKSEPKNAIVPKKVKIKPKKKEIKQVKTLDADIYGTFLGKEFKIVVGKKQNNGDLRTITHGKVCGSYTKPELIVIADKLGVKINGSTPKDQMCNLIYEHLDQNNLVVKKI